MAQVAEICCEFMFVCAVAVCEKNAIQRAFGKKLQKSPFFNIL